MLNDILYVVQEDFENIDQIALVWPLRDQEAKARRVTVELSWPTIELCSWFNVATEGAGGPARAGD